MKQWLKRHGKWIVVAIGVVFIANAVWSIVATEEKWLDILNTMLIAAWTFIILLASGALSQIYTWWERD